MNRTAMVSVCVALLLSVALRARAGDAAPDAAAIAAVAPERLTRGALSPEAYAFKQKVYTLHVARGVKAGRVRIFDLPPSELAEVPGTDIVMRRDAAAALGRLMAAARADLAADLASTAGDPQTTDRRARAGRVRDIALNNAYRSASTQFGIWDRNFGDYLAATEADRQKCPGGEYGDAAAALLRDYIGVRVAAPGFSNHQGGIAVDFALPLKPATAGAAGGGLGPSMAQTDPWKESWFWQWLNRRAGEFGFIAYLPEPWHWEYKPDRIGKGRES